MAQSYSGTSLELTCPSGVPCVEPLAVRYPIPNTPDRPGAPGPRCGVSPGSTSFPWSPGPGSRPGLLSSGRHSPSAPARVGDRALCGSRPGKGHGQGWKAAGRGVVRPFGGCIGQSPDRLNRKGTEFGIFSGLSAPFSGLLFLFVLILVFQEPRSSR